MPRSSDQLTKDFGSAAPKIQILPSHIDHEADNHYVEAHVFNYDDLGNNWSENLTMRIDEREVQIFERKPHDDISLKEKSFLHLPWTRIVNFQAYLGKNHDDFMEMFIIETASGQFVFECEDAAELQRAFIRKDGRPGYCAHRPTRFTNTHSSFICAHIPCRVLPPSRTVTQKPPTWSLPRIS